MRRRQVFYDLQSSRNPRIYGGDKVVVFASKSKIAMNNLKDALGVASSAARIAVVPGL
ncbi:hypothetical protein MESS2_120021 [Mesorhizobium metallidurans STM 2683]|uniref:Polysaccharide export protein n=1 Tax=Mesorhizobium metallidurans STM 2683 TaxID=1297569 RepID=M5EJ24_9HYPH|nr:hypothetical protein MESS2_120021 [Mesorhizobium metallidurans STM 2683]